MASVAKSIRIACSGSPHSAASWSSRPVSAPTQSFSTREQMRASSRRSAGSSSPATASRASASAASSAADEERPEPCSRSPSIGQPGGPQREAGGAQLGHHAAREGAPARGPFRRGQRERVLLAEVERANLDLVAGERLGGDRDAALDRERQREAVVVVGVLADQVHAAGPAGPDPLSQGALA